MTRFGFVLAVLGLMMTLPASAQDDAKPEPIDPDGHYAIFHADGRAADLDAVLAAMADADVVFLGEIHTDPVAHALQLALLEAAHQTYGDTRPVALSLEMIERDAQLVLDEYLAGLIRERDFLAASRPWGNYATDYRPLVEYAKAHGLPVVAANAPGRYVSRTGREGVAGLDILGDEARAFLAPLPIAPASETYAAKFQETMQGMMAHGAAHTAAPADSASTPAHSAAMPAMPSLDNMLAAQNLRDATMGFSMAEHLARHPGTLILHMNGSFHSEGGMGTPDHLAHYAPGTRVLIVTMAIEADFAEAPAPSEAPGFLIQTDQALQPSE